MILGHCYAAGYQIPVPYFIRQLSERYTGDTNNPTEPYHDDIQNDFNAAQDESLLGIAGDYAAWWKDPEPTVQINAVVIEKHFQQYVVAVCLTIDSKCSWLLISPQLIGMGEDLVAIAPSDIPGLCPRPEPRHSIGDSDGPSVMEAISSVAGNMLEGRSGGSSDSILGLCFSIKISTEIFI